MLYMPYVKLVDRYHITQISCDSLTQPELLALQESAELAATDYVSKTVQAPEVKHPLLDKVRACSVNPEQAADFFLWELHPIDTWRLNTDAAHHPYWSPLF